MYYDLLAKMKNAVRAKKESFTAPFSNFDSNVAAVLVAGKYLKDAQKKTVGSKKFLEIKPAYKNKVAAVNDFKIISKPSRRIYATYRDIKPVKQGYGLGVLSTSKGVISDREARKKKIGGEYLFQIW